MLKILVFLSLLPFINTLPQRLYERIFYPDNYYESQYFGYDVIITDTIMFISAVQDDSIGNASGSVYFYRKNDSGWVFIKKILASDGRTMDMFGTPYLSSNFLYVGATNRGAVYVFEYLNNDWVEIQKLLPDTIIYLSGFGRSIKEFNNELFVGANLDSKLVEGSGAVYVFKKMLMGFGKNFRQYTHE